VLSSKFHTYCSGDLEKPKLYANQTVKEQTAMAINIDVKRKIYLLYVLSGLSGWGPFCVEFACFPCVCMGSLRVPQLPPTAQKHACQVN